MAKRLIFSGRFNLKIKSFLWFDIFFRAKAKNFAAVAKKKTNLGNNFKFKENIIIILTIYFI